jgi:hypothetical protein
MERNSASTKFSDARSSEICSSKAVEAVQQIEIFDSLIGR